MYPLDIPLKSISYHKNLMHLAIQVPERKTTKNRIHHHFVLNNLNLVQPEDTLQELILEALREYTLLSI